MIMEVEEAVVAVVLYLRNRRKRRKRRFWVHPILQDRSTKGLFFKIYSDLRQNPDKFLGFVRMTIASFDALLECVQDQLTSVDTNMRDSITPVEKLLITLRYLASGSSMTELHLYFRLGLSTVSTIIKQVCQEIWRTMNSICLALPETSRWKNVAAEFKVKANFPNCVGALGAKHIRMIKPQHSGSIAFKYKNFFSLELLAMCDSNYLFTVVDVGAYGYEGDTTVFKNSRLYEMIINDNLKLPKPAPISEPSGESVPFVFVADESFALSKHVMRPFGKSSLTTQRKVFNYRHSRAQRYIECAFGIMSNKWQIFHRPLNVNVSLAEDILKACCVLHNYVISRDGYSFEETLTVQGLRNLQYDTASRGTKAAVAIRDKFADYFVSPEGELEWQYRVVS